jgi:type IV fimbrial biogenesis protein FimT/type IV fimbrial biogenesis protein FimU
MISRTGPTQPPASSAAANAPATGAWPCHPPRRTPNTAAGAGAGKRAFTLLELLLALAIVVMVLAGGVLLYMSLMAGRRLEEGAWRVESMLRMARADAAQTGRRVRLSFGAEDGQWQILWESDPLSKPGEFSEYTACTWRSYLPSTMVRVQRCDLVGPSAYQTLQLDAMNDGGSEAEALHALTFYPDGSCDSATIELVDKAGEDLRTAIIDLDGLTGTATTRIMTPSELQGA